MISVDQKYESSVSGLSALSAQWLKSRCRPGLHFSPDFGALSPSSLVVGRIHFLEVAGLSCCVSFSYQLEISLSSYRVCAIPFAPIYSSQPGCLLSSRLVGACLSGFFWDQMEGLTQLDLAHADNLSILRLTDLGPK